MCDSTTIYVIKNPNGSVTSVNVCPNQSNNTLNDLNYKVKVAQFFNNNKTEIETKLLENLDQLSNILRNLYGYSEFTNAIENLVVDQSLLYTLEEMPINNTPA